MFNKKKLALVGSMIFSAALNTSASAEGDWYVGFNLDSVDLSDVNTESTSQVANVTRRIDLQNDSDTGFGLKVGRNLFTSDSGNSLALELSYASSEHDIDAIRFMNNNFLTSEGRAEGEVEVESILLRAVYQFELGAIDPYVGIGIGSVDFSGDGRYGASVGTAAGTTPPFFDANDSATAVQFRLGAEYDLNDAFGVYLEYSRTEVDDIEFLRRGGGPGGLASTTQSGDFDFDSFGVGINYRF